MTRAQRGVFFLLVLAFLSVPFAAVAVDGCEKCPRRAFLKEVKNLHAPSYEQDMKEWNICMAEHRSYETFDPGDEQFQNALEECGPGPGEKPVMYPGPVASYLTELLRSPCFAITWPGARVCELPPEYFFTAEFDGNPAGTTDSGKPVKSTFTIKLFYDGDVVEEVDSWTTKSTAKSISSQYNRMFKNSDAAMKRSVPLEETLWDFERQPLSCNVTAEKKRVRPGETIRILLDDFRDERGRPAKDFQRIVVTVREGRIKNGGDSQYGFQSRVFRVGDGRIELQYEAPHAWRDEQGRELVTVYNSCDIAKTSVKPLFETTRDKKVAEQQLEIVMPEGEHVVLGVIYKQEWTERESESYYREVRTHLEEVSATIRSPITFQSSSKGRNENEIRETYLMTDPRLVDFRAKYLEFLVGAGISGVMNERTTGSAPPPFAAMDPVPLHLILEGDSGRIKEVCFPAIDVPVEWTLSCRYRYDRRGGPVETKSRVYRDTYTFIETSPLTGSPIAIAPPQPPGALQGDTTTHLGDPEEGRSWRFFWRILLTGE